MAQIDCTKTADRPLVVRFQKGDQEGEERYQIRIMGAAGNMSLTVDEAGLLGEALTKTYQAEKV